MIRIARGLLLFFCLFLPWSRIQPAPASLEIKLGQSREIGHDKDTFGSIVSVCEDEAGNFYVLDRIEHRVHKFSPEGRPLLTFGEKGQGPGDFQSPGRIALSSRGELAVLEDLYYVSFFTPEGVFLRRLGLNGRLGLGYVGPDCFYGWIWRPEDKQQVIIDGRNAIVRTFQTIAKEEFSVSVPEPGGRAVMFNYGPEAYAPSFLFDYNGALSAVAVSREMIRKIPELKNPVRDVRLSPERLFVFRFGPDVTASTGAVPVDIFTLRGEFQGSGELPDIPLRVGAESMYFARTEESGLVFLEKMDYRLD